MRHQLFAASALAVILAACAPESETSASPDAAAPAAAPAAALAGDFSGPDWAHDSSDLPVDEAIVYGQLENGMRYAIMANETPSGGASLRMRFDDVGQFPAQVGESKSLGHFLEHMVFNGSENVPEGELVRILEREGLSFGADTNAYVSMIETVYMLEIPRVETLETGLFLFRESADKLLLDPEAIDRERGVIIQEARMRDNPQRQRFREYYEFLFPGSGVGEAVFEDRELVETATRDQFLELYHGFYRPERTMLVVVGDFDVAEIEAMVRETFADFSQPGEAAPAPVIVREPPPSETRARVFVDPGIQTVVQIAAPVIDDPSDDVSTIATSLEDVRAQIGNSALGRRLTTLSDEPDAVILGGFAGGGEVFDALDISSIGVLSEPVNWREAVAVAEQELRRALEHGFTRAELTEQIANIRASLEAQAAAADTRESGQLAQAIVNSYASQDVVVHPRDQLALFEQYEDQLTPESILAAFRAQWTDRAPQVFLSIAEEIEGGDAALLAAYEESRAVPVDPPAEADTAEFAYTDFGAPGEVVSRTENEELGATQLTFANSVRLNVKQTDFEDDEVLIRVAVAGGSLSQPAEPAWLHLLAGAYIDGGLEAHSVDELRRILAGTQISRSFSVSSDHFTLGSSTRPQDMQQALQLLAAYLTAPGYREDALTRYRRGTQIQYDSQVATPLGVFGRDFSRMLYDGDSRFGSPESVEEATAPDFDALRGWVEPAMASGAMEITIVGDIAVDEAVAAVAATFGALPERDAERTVTGREGVTGPSQSETAVHEGEADAGVLAAAWPASSGGDLETSVTLQLLGGVLDLKANDAVREQAGAAYFAQAGAANSREFPNWGAVYVLSDPTPPRFEEVTGIYRAIAAEAREGEISEDELTRARAPLIENLRQNQEQNGYWLGVLDESQADPESVESHRRRLELLEAVTVADLVEAANTYLIDEAMLTFSVGPGDAAAD